MSFITKTINRIDQYQQRHRLPAFSYAVIKKYHEDKAGHQAALLTYYGFLALFPLLMVLTTLTEMALGNHSELQATIIKGVTDYFPLLGTQISNHVQALNRNNFALVVGILFALYGARGMADVLRHGIQNIWGVPEHQREAFLPSLIKNILIIVIGGMSLLEASLLASLTTEVNRGWEFQLASVAITLFAFYWLFNFLINLSLPRHVKARETRLGAAAAAIGLVTLQLLGGYIVTRELKSLDALYSYFAVALGLFFWIYLQAQIIYYATVIAAVSSKKLWPRSFKQ